MQYQHMASAISHCLPMNYWSVLTAAFIFKALGHFALVSQYMYLSNPVGFPLLATCLCCKIGQTPRRN